MSDYISVTDTAKMLRAALKRHWPTVKFSVRSHSYAGGASIRVAWNDGPSGAMVDRVAQRFAGASFDGMIDLKSYHREILVNDVGAMREVHFGADYVFATRTTKPGLFDAIEAEYGRACAVDTHDARLSRDHWYNRALAELDIPPDEPVEETARRVVRHIWPNVTFSGA